MEILMGAHAPPGQTTRREQEPRGTTQRYHHRYYAAPLTAIIYLAL